MKKKTYLIILLLVWVLLSCKDEPAKNFNLAVDVQGGFEQDDLQVFIDNEELLNAKVQTNQVLGVCNVNGKISHVKNLIEGKHEIKAVLNGSITLTQSVTLHNNLYIGVNYNRQESKFYFNQSNQPFGYD